MAKEDEIKIPESVLNRASATARRGQAIADTGSIFTEREREMPRQSGGMGYPSGPFQQGGLPRFPFGGLPSTSLDVVQRGNSSIFSPVPTEGFSRTNPNAPFEFTRNEQNVQYTQDAATRMANRYTMPTVGIAQQNISFGNPFGNRFSATDYVNPEQARRVEISNADIATMSPISSSPDVGTAGFSRSVDQNVLGQGRTEQIVSPYGFASTTLTPQQVEQRAQARQQAEQMGTMPRTPEQQQALLAQMRTRGAEIGRQSITGMEEFFTDKRAERKLANDSGLDGGSTYYKSQPSSIAGIQRDYANYQGAGFGKMTDFVQSMIRGELSGGIGTGEKRSIFGSGFNPTSAVSMPRSEVSMSGGVGGGFNPAYSSLSDYRSRYPSGAESRARRRARPEESDSRDFNPVLPRELQGA